MKRTIRTFIVYPVKQPTRKTDTSDSENEQVIPTHMVHVEMTGLLDGSETLQNPTTATPYPVELVTNQINSSENFCSKDDSTSLSASKCNFGTERNGCGQYGFPKDGDNKTCTVSSSSIKTETLMETQCLKTEYSTEHTTSIDLPASVSHTAQVQSWGNIPKKESAVVSTENLLYAIWHDHLSYVKSDELNLFLKESSDSETPTSSSQTADTCSSNIFQKDLPLPPVPHPVSLIKSQLRTNVILSLETQGGGCPVSTGIVDNQVRRTNSGLKKESNVQPEESIFLRCHGCHAARKFLNRSTLFSHIKRIHMATKPVMCSVCDMEIKTPASFHKHQLKHLGLRPFSCKSCPKTFLDLFGVKQHQRQVHRQEEKVDDQKNCASNIVCDVCNVFFISPQDRKEHSAVHTGETPYVCKKCPKAFRGKTKLKKHEGSHPEKTPFACQVCKREFLSKKGLTAHKPFHIRKTAYMCGVCGKSVSALKDALRHRRVHAGENPFSCNLCGKSFHAPRNLQLHKKYAHSGRSYVCETCDKSFKTREMFKRHQLYHSGVNPHVCEICSKTFYKKRNLRRHRRLHSGDKPFKCTLCDRAYVGRSELNAHVRNSHSGNFSPGPYISQRRICDICGITFPTLRSVTHHMKVHSGVKDHLCSVCGKAFYSFVCMRRHERMHANKN